MLSGSNLSSMALSQAQSSCCLDQTPPAWLPAQPCCSLDEVTAPGQSVQQLSLFSHKPNMHHKLLSGQLTEHSHSGEKAHPLLDSAGQTSLQRHYGYRSLSKLTLSLMNYLLDTLLKSLNREEIQFQADQN